MKRAVSKRVVVQEESESEEETEDEPPSPAAQRKEQWANYRLAQVDAHQARTAHYTRALDRVLGFFDWPLQRPLHQSCDQPCRF